MSDAQDIRQWARDQGMAVSVKGPLPRSAIAAWEAQQDGALSNGDSPAETAPLGEPGGDSPETRPAVKARSWFKDRRKREPRAAAPRRVSIENVVSSVWGIGAMMLARNPQALPVARVLDMQAPVAGIVVNDLAKGTALDRLLQPLARAGTKGEQAVALLGPPVLVGAITVNPQLYPVVRPLLKMSIMSWLEVSEPAMKKAQARQARFSEKFGDVDIDGMIDSLFAPPPGYDQPDADSTQEDENIRRAGGGA